MGLTIFDRLYFVKSNIFVRKGLDNFFWFSSLKTVNYPCFIIEWKIASFCVLSFVIQNSQLSQGKFCLKQLVVRVCQNSRKAKSMLRNIIMFQVTQYLRDKTGCGQRGGFRGKMSYRPLGIVERGIFSLLLCVLWYDLGPQRVRWWNFKEGFSNWRSQNT